MAEREPLLLNQAAAPPTEESVGNSVLNSLSQYGINNVANEDVNGLPTKPKIEEGTPDASHSQNDMDPSMNIPLTNGMEEHQTSQNVSNGDSCEEKAVPKQITAAEGFLTVCGRCKGKVLFPLGLNRVVCAHCNAINYLDPNMIPFVAKKALLLCPQCRSSILYTIGCTHFQCTCGCCIEIPIPDYYIPHFPQKMETK